MRTAWIRFEPADWEIEIYPATSENENYVRAMKILAAPHQLAVDLNRIREERALDIMCQVVADSIIAGSSGPGLPTDVEGWHAWLREHPDELEVIVLTARVPEDWEAMADGSTADDLQEPR